MRRMTRLAMLITVLPILSFGTQAGAGKHLIESRESQYNSIFITRNPPYIAMSFGHNKRLYTESLVNRNDQLELPVIYTRFMTLPFAYRSGIETILEIGLGGGSTVWYLHKTFPGIVIQAVEIDPVVVELAEKYFFLKQNARLDVAVRDGRLFMARAKKKYDVILIDAYRGPFVPFHLLTREFFQLVKKTLTEGGVVAQNVEPTTMLYDAALATLASVFDNVDIFQASGNYVALAYDGPEKSGEELEKRAAGIDQAFSPRYRLSDMIARRRIQSEFNGQVLTDDFAPVETLNATKRHNRRFQQR